MADPSKILVVDDEPDVADLIQLRFRDAVNADRYCFLSALDGTEALEQLERNPDIAVVLTDIRMPRMDGLTLLSRLSEVEHTLRTIVVTAYGDMTNIRIAMNRGAFDFLTKPLDFGDLETTIDKALRAVDRQMRAEQVGELFGRYLSKDILASLLNDPGAVKLGGERRRLTLLMSDLRGFSSLAERLPPEQVVELLNVYLGRMTEVISRYGGTIDEFIGDAIFVIFGAPLAREDHALRAVACAVEMQITMEDVNQRLQELDFPELQMGIGVNTGEVVVGNIGSFRRAKYGVVGSPVNLLSRIESCTVGRQILVADTTLREAGAAVRSSRTIEVKSKGFSEPVLLHDVVGVGAPYDLTLAERLDPMTALAAPLPCRYLLVNGGRLNDVPHRGEILELSASRATLRTDDSLELLSSLRVSMHEPDFSVEGLYAKVTGFRPAQRLAELHFTSLPEAFQVALDRLRARE